MHKTLLYTFCLCTGTLAAQDLHFYNGSTPVIDGTISAGEWTDSDSCQVVISSTLKTTVRYKHDGAALYFVFYNHLESAIRFPEVNLDINHSQSAAWEGDDWWFHVSGTDCESNGAPNVYTDCAAIQPDWEAVPNFAGGGVNEDTVEMRIPFTKMGFVYSGGPDTIGISLDVTNTFSAWNMYPSTAVVGDPSTWANGIFHGTSIGFGENHLQQKFAFYPNPASDRVYIKGGAADPAILPFMM